MPAGGRLFVAVGLPRPAVDSLVAAVAGLPTLPAVRWVPPERWHLTVLFLGQVDGAGQVRLERELAGVAVPAFELRLAGAGRFPPRGRPAVLWVGVAGQVAALAGLHDAVRRAARAARVGPAPGQRYRPHLTVARFRPPPPAGDVEPGLRALAGYDGPTFPATRFTLVRSHLGPSPRHEAVASWSLAAPATS